MRITNSMMIDRVVTNLNTGLLKTNRYNMQLGSKHRLTRLSDDPVGVLSSMTARQNIRSLKRYQESVTAARNWVDQTESALMDMEEVLVSIKENVIDACGTKNEDDKKNIAAVIEQMNGYLTQCMNTTVGDKYIFGGFNTTEAPFTRAADGTLLYNGIDPTDTTQDFSGELNQKIEFEIGYNMNMEVSFTGLAVVGVGEDSLFNVLDNLVADLRKGMSNEDLSNTYLGKVESLRGSISTLTVEVGTKTQRLDLMENRYSLDAINYEAIRTDVEEIDTAETIMKMKMSETVYQQALAVGARIIQPTLMDFLK